MSDVSLRSAVYKGNTVANLIDSSSHFIDTSTSAVDAFDTHNSIDLNEHLVKNKPATYFFRMHSNAMQNAGIYLGDILIVDRSLPAVSGKIIVAALGGELVVRRYQQLLNKTSLLAESVSYSSIPIDDLSSFKAWGVVTYVIHPINS